MSLTGTTVGQFREGDKLIDIKFNVTEKMFDSVLVVSDRNVLDAQLQEAIFDFERTTGVVATIKGESASKSGELAKALSGGKKIVVCTIQTFPFALEEVRRLAATEQRRGPALRHAAERKRHPLGRQLIILKPKIDRGRGARAHRDRRIVGQQEHALDRRLIGGPGRNGRRNGEKSKGKQNGTKSHGDGSRPKLGP